MTALPNNDRTVRLSPSAGATTLAYDFWIARAEDLVVWRVRAGTSVQLALTTDYSVSGVGNDAGGTVTLAAAAQAGDAYVLAGSWLVQQVLDLVTAGDFRADDVDHQHRLILAALMELRRDVARQLGVPIYDDGSGAYDASSRPVRGLTYLELDEATVAAPAANKLRLYAKDVAGVTKVYARTATEEIDLSGAALAASAAAASAAAALASASAADAAADAAEAAAAAVDIPTSLSGQALKVLRVKSDESGYEHVAAGSGDVVASANFGATRRVIVSANTTKGVEVSPITHSADGDVAGVRHQAQTGYSDLAEISAPANPDSNVARLYAKDVGGTTRLVVRDSAGVETVIGSSAGPGPAAGRLTNLSGSPELTATSSGAANIFFCPFRGDITWLYTGSSWTPFTLTELSLALSGGTASRMHDVFCYSNSGTPTLELEPWTDNATPASALTYLNGLRVKASATTRLFLGSVYLNASKQIDFILGGADTAGFIGLWNEFNRRPWSSISRDTTNLWSYAGGWRQANASANNQCTFAVGRAGGVFSAVHGSLGSTSSANGFAGIGYDTTSNYSGLTGAVGTANAQYSQGSYSRIGEAGLHYMAAVEHGGTGVTFYGDAGAPTQYQSGLIVTGEF